MRFQGEKENSEDKIYKSKNMNSTSYSQRSGAAAGSGDYGRRTMNKNDLNAAGTD